MRVEVGPSDALIVVDFQRDFCPGGALPVAEGNKIGPMLNSYIGIFSRAGAPIYATRDWHPADHISFKAQGGIWPQHCVQGTEGAKFHPGLDLPDTAKVISKATEPSKEAYSGFDGTDLLNDLKKGGISRVFVGGLATDYCVKNTVLDALRFGLRTVLLIDAIRGVNLNPDDSKKAIKEMEKQGAIKAVLSDFVRA